MSYPIIQSTISCMQVTTNFKTQLHQTTWICNNQLKPNEDKTDAILFLTPSLPSDCLPSSVTVGADQIAFSGIVSNLGVVLDSKITMKQHVIKVHQITYCDLKSNSSICTYFSEDTTKKLGTSCVLSKARLLQFSSHRHTWLWYWTSAENLVFHYMSYSQSTAPLTLLTLPTATSLAPDFCGSKTTACMCHSSIIGSAVLYLCELMQLYSHSCCLCFSWETCMLKLWRFNLKILGHCCFSYSGPHIWTSHPSWHQTLYYTPFLQKQTQSISLLWAFEPSNTVLRPNSPYNVCVCVCMCVCERERERVCVCVCVHSCLRLYTTLSSCVDYLHFFYDIHYLNVIVHIQSVLFSTLSHRVGAV